MVGGSICLVLAIVATVFLFRFKGQADEKRSKLEKAVAAVKGLKRADVYPTDANAAALSKEIERLEKHHAALREQLREGQAEVVDVQASRFGIHVAEFRARLTDPKMVEVIKADEATQAGTGFDELGLAESGLPAVGEGTVAKEDEEPEGHRTKVSESFGFSFDDYIIKGRRPKNDEVPRLTVQMQLVERLCIALYDAGVDEVVAIDRDVFEVSAQGFSGGDFLTRDSALPPGLDDMEDEGDDEEEPTLYEVEEFRLEFTANESALWEALNLLADENGNMVVKAVELTNKSTLLQPQLAEVQSGRSRPRPSRVRPTRRPVGGAQDEGAAPLTLPGDELVQVVVDVHAVLFNADPEAAVAEDEGASP